MQRGGGRSSAVHVHVTRVCAYVQKCARYAVKVAVNVCVKGAALQKGGEGKAG